MRKLVICVVLFLTLSDVSARALSLNGGSFAASGQGSGQIQRADLDGVVLSADGSPLPANVMVALCDTGGVVIQQNAVSSGNKFLFQGLRKWEYILKVTADSFEPQEVRVNLQFGNLHGVIVYLKPLHTNSNTSAKAGSISSHELSMAPPGHELLVSGREKLYHENNPPGALKDFLAAQQKAPGFYEVNYEIGMAYLRLGQKQKAEDCFAEAIAISKDTFADAQIALGTLQVDRGDFNEGEKKIQRGIQLNPNLWMGYYQLARLKVIRGEIQGAEVDAEHSRSLAPTAPINYQLLSTIHLRQKNYVQLVQDIDRYLELDPESPAAERAREIREQIVRAMSEKSGGAIGEVTLTIGVRNNRGVPLEESATVRLRSQFEGAEHVATTAESSEVRFTGVLKGPYEMVVECPGYHPIEGHLDVSDEQGFFKSYIYMRPLTEPDTTEGPTKRLSLPLTAIQEIDQGLADMRKKRYESAQRHFTKAADAAPSSPDLFYFRGKAELSLKQDVLAKRDFEQALSLDPSFESARLSLGELQLQGGDTARAIATLNEAYLVNGASWKTHYLLAIAYAKAGDWKNSEDHAQHAVNVAHGQSAEALLLLGNVQSAQGEWDAARLSWKRLLTDFPKTPEAAQASAKIATAPQGHAAEGRAKLPTLTLPAVNAKLPKSVEERVWAPPDIDEKEYPLASGISCSADDILPRAQRRMQSQLGNFEKFTATEKIEHQEIDRQGQGGPIKSRDFSYMAFIRVAKDNSVYLEELRDGGLNLSSFPTSLAAIGLNSIAVLLLQPVYRTEYIYQCQGLTNARDQAAWEIRFEERENAERHVFRWKRSGVAHDIPIKGLIWIASTSYDVLRLETDLREPEDYLELARDHLIVDYGPVAFREGQSTLWLPWTAEMYLELRGRRYHHKHSLTNYMMFSVDSRRSVNYPKDTTKDDVE